MLVLSRFQGESIECSISRDELWRWMQESGHDTLRIRLLVVRIQEDKVRLGVEAPREVTVHREEVARLIERQSLFSTSPQTHSRVG